MKDKKKKEDQEYIDTILEKQNTFSKQNTDFYKSLDSSFLIGGLFVSFLFIILFILFRDTSNSILNNHVISLIFAAIFIFSVVYVIFSFLFWIVGLTIKTKNYKYNLIVKLSFSIILTIIITIILSVPI